MKSYEAQESERRLMPRLPVCARIDGRGFSRFTRAMTRPYEPRLSKLMIATTRFLVTESAACMGYTQSDEISLIWDGEHQVFFEGRVQKMTSVLASLASAYFNRGLAEELPEHARDLQVFDARVWSVPSREEAANTLLWREQDATKNSVSMAARTHYPHAALEGRSSKEMQAMLLAKGVNWNDFPAHFKRGTYVQRRFRARAFDAEEIAELPEKHAARSNPDLVVSRAEIVELDVPPLARVINRVNVVFEAQDPVVAEGG